MSASGHPVAKRLVKRLSAIRGADSPSRILATVMLLPLVDGIFPAFVLAGGLDSVAGIFQTGLLVFGGSATVAVVLAEFGHDRRNNLRHIATVGGLLIPLAAIEAVFAPTFASVIDTDLFEPFAAIVLFAIACKTVSAEVGKYLPRPSVIIALGFLASVNPETFEVATTVDFELVGRAILAALVGVLFAALVAVFREQIATSVDVDRFRFGSAISLGILGVALLDVVPMSAPLVILAVATILSYHPEDATQTH